MTTRVRLTYDAGLLEPGTWRTLDAGRGVALRLRVGGIEYASEIALRWKQPGDDDAVFASPVDAAGSIWLTAPAALGGGLLRRELQLERAPEWVAERMLGW